LVEGDRYFSEGGFGKESLNLHLEKKGKGRGDLNQVKEKKYSGKRGHMSANNRSEKEEHPNQDDSFLLTSE